jgi:SAM-dependent methyltransferase
MGGIVCRTDCICRSRCGTITDPAMTQNIYDDPAFFAGYSRLGRSVEGLDGAAEWPALRALLPDMRGLGVVDLGCGFGWFCRWARGAGAARVLGIDVSEKMLARAAAATSDPTIAYLRTDMERLDLEPGSFDLAYSSLALHYVADLAGLLANLHRALVSGGRLVFSAEHPIFTAPTRPGWSVDADGRKTWPVDAYLVEGQRTTDWLAKGVVKQHRTLGTYLNLLITNGFVLTHVEEWGPTDAQILARPGLADERQRPPFLLVAAQR